MYVRIVVKTTILIRSHTFESHLAKQQLVQSVVLPSSKMGLYEKVDFRPRSGFSYAAAAAIAVIQFRREEDS